MELNMYIINNNTKEDIAHWRNNYKLHNTFQKLALYKNIKFYSFICIPVPLTQKDIDFIIANMPNTAKDSKTMGILNKCKFIIGMGGHLSYDSWC